MAIRGAISMDCHKDDLTADGQSHESKFDSGLPQALLHLIFAT
jgi:hypothetical protein